MSECHHSPTVRLFAINTVPGADGCPICLSAECAALREDAERLDWIEKHLIEGKWDGTIGRPKSWHMIGPYRHTLHKMRGDTLREAIDAAMGESHE